MTSPTAPPVRIPTPLITPEELAGLLAAPAPPVVLDVRWRLGGPPGRADHEAGHIPGAAFVDLDAELAGPPGAAGRHPLPDPAAFAEAMRRAGVREESAVVAYDDDSGAVAARAWWLLRWSGVPADRVAVLDGGHRAWVRAGLPVSTEPSRPEPGDLVVRPGGMPVVDADGAAATALAGVLLDARAGARYRGETEPVDPAAGHLPGAVNAPATDHLDATGRWSSPESLARHYAALGVPAGGEAVVGAYCGSGVTATAVILALEHSGMRPAERPAALYAGSWSQWSADPARPVATGADP